MACFAEDGPGTTMTPMDKKEPGNTGFFYEQRYINPARGAVLSHCGKE